MIKVNVTKQSSYPISAPKIKKVAREFLKNNGVVSYSVVDISIVGKSTMLDLAQKFLKEKNVLHNVLSFTESEKKGGFQYAADDVIYLGEIVLCYPQVVSQANQEGVLIDEKVRQLVEHGCLHLLGIHHS